MEDYNALCHNVECANLQCIITQLSHMLASPLEIVKKAAEHFFRPGLTGLRGSFAFSVLLASLPLCPFSPGKQYGLCQVSVFLFLYFCFGIYGRKATP